ncbi:MAG TPA: hypothetical protein DFI01_11260 [Bacteroidales bacterium]|nr:hypothetical protein [Bacteroidales bacterium]
MIANNGIRSNSSHNSLIDTGSFGANLFILSGKRQRPFYMLQNNYKKKSGICIAESLIIKGIIAMFNYRLLKIMY